MSENTTVFIIGSERQPPLDGAHAQLGGVIGHLVDLFHPGLAFDLIFTSALEPALWEGLDRNPEGTRSRLA